MAPESRRRAGAEESSAPKRKRAGATHSAFDVKREVFAVGKMSRTGRKILQDRLQSELVAIRDLLEKAEFLVPEAVERGATPSSSSPSAPRGKHGRFLAVEPRSEAPMEDEGNKAAKRRKKLPLMRNIEPPKMTPDEREQLAARLASLSAELSAHILKTLQRHRDGARNDVEIGILSVEDASLLELKQQLEKFAEERNHHGHEAMDAPGVTHPSPQQREDDGKIVVEEEDEYGGVSPFATAPSSFQREFGEIVNATGVRLLSPLQRKYVVLTEEVDEYVDICGDASPVVIQNLGVISSSSSSPSSTSSSDSDSDSDSGSDNDSDLGSDSDDSVSSPAPAALPKANGDSAQPPEPAPEVVQHAEPEKLPEQRAAAPSARPMNELIAKAQGALERRRQEEKAQAREKARQELLEMERTALAGDSIHPMDMKLLGIAAVQYIVSSHGEAGPAQPPDGALRLAPGCPSLLQQLGLFLKADDDCGEEQERQPSFVLGVEDVEEGEIRSVGS